MSISSESLRQIIRNLFSISSLIFLALLVVQVLKIEFQFIPEQLHLSEEEVKPEVLKEFHASDTYTNFEIVGEHSMCSPGYHSVVTIYNRENDVCQCGDQIYYVQCYNVHYEIQQLKNCKPINPSSLHSNFVLPLNPHPKEQQGEAETEDISSKKKIRLCGKKIDSTKLSQINETNLSGPSIYKQCTFTDTNKLGLVDNFSECPKTSLRMQCQHGLEKKCETKFFISCIRQNETCLTEGCGEDEIGCVSKYSSFCLKNTEQCPLTDLQLIYSTHVPQGYEELDIKFKSDYKLIGRRSNLQGDFIHKIVINLSDQNIGETFKGFEKLGIQEFTKLNKIQLSSYDNNYDYEKLKIQRKYHYESIQIYGKTCSKTKIEKYNEQMYSVYDTMLTARLWCIRLLLIKLFFELVRFIQGYNNSKTQQEDKLGNLIDKWNIYFFFAAEIVALVLILTVFTKHIFHEGPDQRFYQCLIKLNKEEEWETASEMLYIKKSSYLVILTVVIFGIVKLITMLALIFQYFWEKKMKYSGLQIIAQSNLSRIELEEKSII